jgi:hypothetical protein
MKIVGRSAHVQVHRSIPVREQQPNNVVNLQENTNWIVRILMAMVGMEDILKSMGNSIAKDLALGTRKK